MKKKWVVVTSFSLGIALITGVIIRPIAKRKKLSISHVAKAPAFSADAVMKELLEKLSVSVLLDMGSMGMSILKECSYPSLIYIGTCFSKKEATYLQEKYASSRCKFISLNLLTDIPTYADIILAWDYFCTLSQTEVRAALLNLKKSGAKYVLMTAYPEALQNKKNKTGLPTPVNWSIPPYSFPSPLLRFKEGGQTFAVWAVESLP